MIKITCAALALAGGTLIAAFTMPVQAANMAPNAATSSEVERMSDIVEVQRCRRRTRFVCNTITRCVEGRRRERCTVTRRCRPVTTTICRSRFY